tara:strand:+ start:396 stop:848 length:453 start_codon:yes stop_codon:yes gene_type:complete
MNHCLLEVQVAKAPTLRYTQDNKTPIAEMDVVFDGLRADDKPGELKVVGWGNLAQQLQSTIKAGQKLIIEGRLRMNTLTREDGSKEKRAEFTLSKLHEIGIGPKSNNEIDPVNQSSEINSNTPINNNNPNNEASTWDSSPLVPDTDEIPF